MKANSEGNIYFSFFVELVTWRYLNISRVPPVCSKPNIRVFRPLSALLPGAVPHRRYLRGSEAHSGADGSWTGSRMGLEFRRPVGTLVSGRDCGGGSGEPVRIFGIRRVRAQTDLVSVWQVHPPGIYAHTFCVFFACFHAKMSRSLLRARHFDASMIDILMFAAISKWPESTAVLFTPCFHRFHLQSTKQARSDIT